LPQIIFFHKLFLLRFNYHLSIYVLSASRVVIIQQKKPAACLNFEMLMTFLFVSAVYTSTNYPLLFLTDFTNPNLHFIQEIKKNNS